MRLEHAFGQRSKDIAQNFLQTVVVVDDRPIFYGVNPADAPIIVIEPPSIFDVLEPLISEQAHNTTEDNKSIEEQDDSTKVSETADTQEHNINAKILIDAFADLGLLCSLLSPQKGELGIVKKVGKVAHRADIVILDWYLLSSSSTIALDILTNIIEEDVSQRLRLVSIYTGQPFLDSVVEDVSKQLVKTMEKTGRKYQVEDLNAFTRQAGPIRISVYAKPNSAIPKERPDLRARIVSEAELPACLITEFTEMTAGLVSNVALQSLCVLRDRTHELLGRLHPRLDAPFLSHRTLLPHPEEACDHLAAIVASQIGELLIAARTGDTAGTKATQEWIAAKPAGQWSIAAVPGSGTDKSEMTEQDVFDLLDKGAEKSVMLQQLLVNADKREKRKFYKRLTELFCSPPDAASLDFAFARLTSLSASRSKERTTNGQQAPVLSLGTILERPKSSTEKESYWLCLQPLCDSNRIIEKKRRFPLLKLRKVGAAETFQIVAVNSAGNDIRLEPLLKAYELDNVMFSVIGERDVIQAQSQNNEFCFASDREGIYIWLGTLKQEQAQRVANQFCAQMSRVGLDESEWLRRSSQED